MQDKIKKKDAMAKAHALYKNNSIAKDEYIKRLKALGADAELLNKARDIVPYPTGTSNTSGMSTMSAAYNPKYTYNNIGDLLQQPQQRTYWCGPATASEIVEAYLDSSTYSQSYMASVLGTTTDGTPWYTNRYPMADALNDVENSGWYIPYGTTVEAATFKDHVTFDIDYNRGVAANAYEVGGKTHPHLTGHPLDKTIYHWVAIDGYDRSGYLIHYADSVHDSSVSWAAGVPAYSQIDYVTMARIMNGRGIIW